MAEQFDNENHLGRNSSIENIGRKNQSLYFSTRVTSMAEYFVFTYFDFELKQNRQIVMVEHFDYRNNTPRSQMGLKMINGRARILINPKQ